MTNTDLVFLYSVWQDSSDTLRRKILKFLTSCFLGEEMKTQYFYRVFCYFHPIKCYCHCTVDGVVVSARLLNRFMNMKEHCPISVSKILIESYHLFWKNGGSSTFLHIFLSNIFSQDFFSIRMTC